MTEFLDFLTSIRAGLSRSIYEKLFPGYLIPGWILLWAVLFTSPAFAVPAAPTTHALTQPDGWTFDARQWGDEWNHGWETTEGYTILRDEASRYWVYAVRDDTGKLMKSLAPVGQNGPPTGVPPRLRPTPEVSSEAAKAFQSIRATSAQPCVPLSGTANVLTILINFSDRTTTYGSTQFNALLFGTGVYSMRDYYTEASYGRFTVSAGPGGIAGWYQASQGHDYYGANVGTGIVKDQWPGDLVYEAVRAADNAGFDFAPYDQNGDCQVDMVNIVHQGSGEEASGLAADIWSHGWDLNSARSSNRSHYGAYATKSPCAAGGSIRVNRYVIQPEVYSSGMTTMGVFAHEYGHALGLPDLYDTDNTSEGVGNWSLMAYGTWNGVVRDGDRPAHLDAWSKYKLGWITPTQIGSGSPQSPVVQPADAYASVYQLLNGSPSLGGEYFLIENRRKGGFDAGLPGSGLLIWHIDESQATNNNECYPGGPSCAAQHYKVALVQADNLWHLEKNQNRGDGGDPYPGTSHHGSVTSGSTPGSRLYDGSASGVSITDIAVSGSNITARLSTDGDPNVSYLLAVTKAGTGAGTITSTPAGIDCGSDCSENYPIGTDVTLTAAPAAGSIFTFWSGPCWRVEGATCTVAMDAAKSVTATFTLNTTPTALAVSAGFFHTCGLRSDGTVACWGNNDSGQASPPAGVFIQVSASAGHTCGLRSDGTVACWGDDSYGQASPPVDAFTQVSAGAYHTCGLRSDGTVACWGDDSYGQASPPVDAFTQVSAGGWHTCGVKSDGIAACWGQASYGQSSPPADAFTQVSAGGWHTCGVKSDDGAVACWGYNGDGRASPPAGIFAQLSLGLYHTCGIKSDGGVACWGSNEEGQLGPTLAVSKTGSGIVTSSAGEINCGAACRYTYPPLADIKVTLTAVPLAGWRFTGWSGVCSGIDSCTVTMDADKSVTATFAVGSSYTLTVSKAGTGAGTVTSAPAGIDCGSDCSESYPANTTVTLTATPAAGSSFTGWSGACAGTGSCRVAMTAARSVTATFNAANSAARSLITRYYQSILDRAPDAGGLAHWQGEIVRLQDLGVDIQEVFRVMVDQLFTSPEYLARNPSNAQYVTDLYRTFFDRAPDGGGLSYWTGQLAAGLPRSMVLYSFMFSTEFSAYMRGLFGDTASRGEVYAVVDFYRGFLNRLPDTGGFQYWLGRFRAAQCQGAAAVNAEVEAISRQFLTSTEYANRNRSNRDYVGDLYYAFLRRGGELSGFNFWVTQLNTGAQTRDQARRSFLQSPEFQNRVQQIINQGCLR